VGLGGAGRAGEFCDAMRLIGAEGRGVVVLLRDTHAKIAAELAGQGYTLRQYGLGAQILSSLGLKDLELLTNSVAPKIVGLDGYGLSITGTRRIPVGEA
jgi:3,4-dihydroxy 2-butanone 4-phosphate synthase / GTP cyclohydrolase II